MKEKEDRRKQKEERSCRGKGVREIQEVKCSGETEERVAENFEEERSHETHKN